MYSGKKIGVVVLAYNVEAHIEGVVKTLPNFADRVYVIDDGSPDRTAEVVRAIPDSRVSLIQHKINLGPGAGLSTGYRAALADGMDVVVKVDGDGQMAPEQMENLIGPIVNEQVDYTKGDRLSIRAHRHGMPRFRLFGNLLLTRLTRISSGYWHLQDSQNGFTAISKKALESIDLNFCPYYGYLNDLLVQLNVFQLRIMDIPMPAKYGTEKSSVRLTRYVLKVSLVLLSRFLWRIRMKMRRAFGRSAVENC